MSNSLHHLLAQHLQATGLTADVPPNPAAWRDFLAQVDGFYHETSQALSLWQEAYDAQRREMEGSFELLRQSSATLITGERDKLKAVIGALGEGMCALNENGVLLFINPEGERLLGWDEATLRGQLILDWVMPSGDAETTTEQLFDTLRRGEKVANYDALFIREDGYAFPASYTIDPMMRDGAFGGAVFVFRDITRRKEEERQKERKLKETLLLNRVIATATSTLDLQTVLQTICDELATFLGLPQAAFALLNRTEDELEVVAEHLGRGRVSALGMVIPLTNNAATQEVIRTQKPVVLQDAQNDPRQPALHEIAKRRGTRSVLVIPLLVRGRVLGTLGLNSTKPRLFSPYEIQLAQSVASAASQALVNAQLYEAVQQELAERQRTEEALAQARDKALEVSRLQSELVAKVSHELRTPLTAIIGFAEMLHLGIYGALTEKQSEAMVMIMDSTESLMAVVNDLLDLAQLEAGTLRLEPRPFEPVQLITRMENMMRIIAEAKGLRLVCKVDADLPDQLLGDVDRLHQILINLVNNAVKFTERGEVGVRLYRADATYWVIDVWDSGPGISEEMQVYIFDEFRQVDFSTTRQHRGVGLGLAIVKQLTTAMSGRIELESEVGQGSRFSVWLPLGRAVESSVIVEDSV